MLHAFRLENGNASYHNRWVRTPRWLAEHTAGRALFGSFGKQADLPLDITWDTDVANTNVVFHAGRLLALEEGHMPTEIEPSTLSTKGYCTYGDAIAGPFTAHPKIDPQTGEMLFFGYNATGPFIRKMSYGVINSAGAVLRFEHFDAPYASMVHDFIVTENHVLFPILPLAGCMERMKNNRPPYAWEPDKGAYVGVMRRDGSTKDIVWFRGESCYVFHVMNAWEDGQRIVADVMQYAEPPLLSHPDGRPTDRAKSHARLCRWTFDLSGTTDRFQQEYCDDISGEFPRIDDRSAGLAYRHGWYACCQPDEPPASGIVHVDTADDRRKQYLLPEGDTISEPVSVARSTDALEGDGWLLTKVWRARENRSDLAIFKALEIERGPVALVKLGHRIPDGFHGNWVNAFDMACDWGSIEIYITHDITTARLASSMQ